MENASKALLIAGAILLCILIIAIGMYIYNSAQSTIQDSLTSMSTQEIEAFNNNWESYKGKQTGSNISALVGRLIANAKTFEDEPGKIPAVTMPKITAAGNENITAKTNGAGSQQNYINDITKIKNKIENKHAYYVTFAYADTGYINEIIISYNDPDATTNP